MNANQPKTEPELRELLRRLLRGICVVAVFFASCFTIHGLLISGQFANLEIPPGKVEAIVGHTKLGTRVRLDTGGEVVCSNLIPVQIAVGDQIHKERESFVCIVNGQVLTDFSWIRRNWLFPIRLLVPLGLYLLMGTLYVLNYGQTALGDCVWSDEDPNRPRHPRTRIGLIGVMFLMWLVISLLGATAFGCMGSCIGGIGRALFR